MSRFFRAGMSVVVVACALLLVPISALARYPDDNGHHYGQLSNPGHHFGQLKHHQAPPPAPAPNPAPRPGPKPHPVTGGSSANHSAATGTSAGQPTNETAGVPDLPVTLPLQNVGAGQIDFGYPPDGNKLDWLLLVILPALLAIWLLIAARGALAAARRRTRKAPA